MNQVLDAFTGVFGLPSWSVAQGHGSFLTFEFGEPELRIHEPRIQKHRVSKTEEFETLTRMTQVHGAWQLWIYCSNWELTFQDRQLAHCESDRTRIGQALRFLNGQALVNVDVANDSTSTFTFDLGAVLITSPAALGTYSDEPVEQWMLFQPSGKVLTMRGDGSHRFENASGEDGARD
jgi:hypothetical protein